MENSPWRCLGEELFIFHEKYKEILSLCFPLGKQRLNPRAVSQTALPNPNLLFQRVLGVADLAYSSAGRINFRVGIFFLKKYKIKQYNQLLQRVGSAINNNSIERCF